VHFKLSLTISGLSLHPGGVDSLHLTLDKAHPVTVTLSGPTEREMADRSEQILCDATTEFDPNNTITGAFSKLAEDRLPDGHPPAEEWPKQLDYVDSEGSISPNYVVPMWLMPSAFQDFASQLRSELHAAAEAALGVLRWRSRSLGPPQPFSSRGLSWSFDGKGWHRMPSTGTVDVISSDLLELTREAATELQTLLDGNRLEPLGHVLFREAWSQRRSNRRSSLLLGITALEIGIKEYIAACVPDAEWLAMNSPTPPVVNMLTEYLPTLTAPGDGAALQPFEDETVEALKVGVGVRNRLAHRGADVTAKRLLPTLRAVRNVLWALDVALGYGWAEGHMFPSLEKDVSQGYRRI
jgi:hypothetical protein